MNAHSDEQSLPRGPESKRRVPWMVWGWVLVLGVLAGAAVPFWHLVVEGKLRLNPIGDGLHIDSYGFDLSNLTVAREYVAPVNGPRDLFVALVDPEHVPGREVEQLNKDRYGKWLVGSDRVMGVILGGEARAYPIRVLNWHAVINDTLGGQPIAVSWSGECEGAAVFDRRVAGQVREFRYSGLLYNANLLMYDRQEDLSQESLWSQLMAKAVSGPAASEQATLKALPFSLCTWDRWLAAYPRTTVVLGQGKMDDHYKQTPFDWWKEEDRPPYRVRGYGEGTEAVQPVDRVVAIEDGPRWRVVPVKGTRDVRAAGLDVSTVDRERVADTFMLKRSDSPDADAPQPAVFHAFWFAWHAMHAESSELIGAEREDAKPVD